MRAMIMGTGKYEGLEVVAHLEGDEAVVRPHRVYADARRKYDYARRANGAEPLVRLSDAQRAIAELLEECERLRMQLAACGVVALANTPESASKARQMHQDYMSASCSDVAGAVDREMTLRQQLAERDAEIMEQCRLNGMGAERELKLMTQRDKLAGLLIRARGCIDAMGWDELETEIDAALAEVKPCQESPAPTT